jgi:hypothetical protein
MLFIAGCVRAGRQDIESRRFKSAAPGQRRRWSSERTADQSSQRRVAGELDSERPVFLPSILRQGLFGMLGHGCRPARRYRPDQILFGDDLRASIEHVFHTLQLGYRTP